MKRWERTLEGVGIAIRPMGSGVWCTTKGDLTVHYWPKTDKWRAAHTGIEGQGTRSMIAHYRAREGGGTK